MSPLHVKFVATQGLKRIKRILIFFLGIRELLRLPNISNLSIDWVRSRRSAIRILIRIAFGVVLVLGMRRDYLLGNGLYIYRDTSWPLSTSLFPQAIFSPSAIANSTPDPLGFSRIFFTWPILITPLLSFLLLEGNYRSIVFGAGVLSLGVFLDPTIFMHEFVALTIVILAFLLLKSHTKKTGFAALSRIGCLLSLSLPALVIM